MQRVCYHIRIHTGGCGCDDQFVVSSLISLNFTRPATQRRARARISLKNHTSKLSTTTTHTQQHTGENADENTAHSAVESAQTQTRRITRVNVTSATRKLSRHRLQLVSHIIIIIIHHKNEFSYTVSACAFKRAFTIFLS